jgi:competence ComEA-like helix-hairpin-helix protein
MKRSQTSSLKFIGLLLFALLAFSIPAFARQQSDSRININTASIDELQTLPGIGPKLAIKIIEHRQKHGPFKRPQDLIIVRGMSAKKFRPIAHLLTAGSVAAKNAKQ